MGITKSFVGRLLGSTAIACGALLSSLAQAAVPGIGTQSGTAVSLEMKYMLDTNICIYLIRKKPVQVIKRLQNTNISEIGISVITLSELEYGVAKSSNKTQNRMALAEFLAPFEIVPFAESAAAEYGEIRAFLEKKGTPIGAYDLMIAAHALSLNLILVTNNIREFERIPKLQFENWV